MTIDSATTPSAGGSRVTPHRPTIARATLYLGAVAVLATGVDHIQQYYVDDYSTVPTIGTLFLLNFVSAGGITPPPVAPPWGPPRRPPGGRPAPFFLTRGGLGRPSPCPVF